MSRKLRFISVFFLCFIFTFIFHLVIKPSPKSAVVTTNTPYTAHLSNVIQALHQSGKNSLSYEYNSSVPPPPVANK